MTEELRDRVRELFRIARAEGTQSAKWKLEGDVDDLLALIKEAGFVQLDPDQSLPSSITGLFLDDGWFGCTPQDGCEEGIRLLKEAGWRRVILPSSAEPIREECGSVRIANQTCDGCCHSQEYMIGTILCREVRSAHYGHCLAPTHPVCPCYEDMLSSATAKENPERGNE